MVYKWLQIAQSMLLPTTCRLCRAPGMQGVELCINCRSDLPWIAHACTGCAAPLPSTAVTYCAKCQKKRSALNRCRALFTYSNPVDTWIQDMKFRQDLAAARLLGRLLTESLEPDNSDATSILPVPLHRKRLAERGYNQALEIARPLRKLGYWLELNCCYRSRDTTAQSVLPASRRRQNLRGAFSVKQALDGRNFILIDDVFTTGATLNELARALKHAGANRVEALVIARTVNRNGDN